MKKILNLLKQRLDKKIVEKTILVFILFFCLIIIVDYFNILTLLGFNIKNINFDFLEIFTNSIVVIMLYYITYKTLDREDVNKNINTRNVSIYILEDIYNQCKLYIQLTGNKGKSFSKFLDKEGIRKRYENIPFEKENLLFENIKNGILPSEIVKKYFFIKSSYISFLYDAAVLIDCKSDEYDKAYEEIKKINLDMIDEALTELENLKNKQ